MLLSVYWPGMTGAGAMAGIVAGAATVVVWGEVAGLADTGVYSMLPGWAAALAAAFVFGRWVGNPPRRDWVGAMEKEARLPGGQASWKTTDRPSAASISFRHQRGTPGRRLEGRQRCVQREPAQTRPGAKPPRQTAMDPRATSGSGTRSRGSSTGTAPRPVRR